MTGFQHSFHNQKDIPYFFARCAIKSLYYELSLFPKPGLVSFVDNGAHRDMDASLLYKSLVSLRHYFYRVGQLSISNATQQQLVKLAIDAEKNMLIRTNGVNTHRGAIFALGILCSSMNRLCIKNANSTLTLMHVQKNIIDVWADFLTHQHQNHVSHGRKVIEKYAVVGAKEIAIQGYQVVFDVFNKIKSLNITNPVHFGIYAYCLLLLRVDDTNVLHRVQKDGLAYARKQVANILTITNNETRIEQANQLHHAFTSKNISPGGVADLLGFLYFLKQIF